MEQLQPLRHQISVQQTYACQVTTRPAKAGDQPERDWIAPHLENNGYSRGRRFGRECRRSGDRDNYCHLTTNEIRCHFGQSVILALRPAVFDRHIPAFNITGFTQALTEGGDSGRVFGGGRAVQ